MKSEIHLFIMWEYARKNQEKLLAEISSKFNILKICNITWSPYLVSRNFTRFYGQKLLNNSDKEIHCGKGEFKLIIVEDNSPIYDNRITSQGRVSVNINMFDTKVKLRNLTGGGHKIHGTNDPNETRHDLLLLLGSTVEDFIKGNKEDADTEVSLIQDLFGTKGWNSFDELFNGLNYLSDYVVLRNSENINLEYIKKNGGDIDILSKDKLELIFFLGGELNLNGHYEVSINNQIILFDIYQSNQNLFYQKLEDDIFINKIKVNNIFVPGRDYGFYILIYHAVINNKVLGNKHLQRIKKNMKGFPEFFELEPSQENLIEILDRFMSLNNYYYIKPNDNRVQIYNYNHDLYVENKRRLSTVFFFLSKLISISYKNRLIKISLIKNKRTLLYFKTYLPKIINLEFRIGRSIV